ncbi:hypothetical protein [Bordetella genomosp. 11]|nr:hypothetical protein [Bordetella genomosp. 11]
MTAIDSRNRAARCAADRRLSIRAGAMPAFQAFPYRIPIDEEQ